MIAAGDDPIGLYNLKKLKSEIQFWCLFMVGGAVLSFFLNWVAKFAFGRVGENITLKVRQKLYENILVKQIGWHDDSQNAAGIMSTLLAQDVQTLNSVSTEMLAVTMEAMSSMIGGIVIAFIFTWQVALVAIAIAPFMMIGGIIGAKIDAQTAGNEDVEMIGAEKKKVDQAAKTGANDPNLLANDAINNFRTVTGFGLNRGIMQKYGDLLEPELNTGLKSAHCAGVIFGYSKFIENACIGIILYFGTLIMTKVDGLDGEEVFIAVFAIVFGAFGAGQASAYGPDASKGKRAAVKIFKVTETPSEIDAMNPSGESIPEHFQGRIKFENVWFRYPTRPKQWIFKGLNLEINPMDNIAIVGESGQGKSTFILLLLRFYDAEMGKITIDGVDIKSYDIRQLRAQMGLVMQEPLLFNYSIKENVLYGNQKASNEEIMNACEVSNSRVFIESVELENAVEDDITSLYRAMQDSKWKNLIVEKVGQEDYKKKLDTMAALKKKEDKGGKFHTIKDLLDNRTEQEKGAKLPAGYAIECGTRGSKLSGGQK